MKRYKTGNKDQLILFSQSVEERLDPNDEVFGFECIIDEIDISPIERKYSTQGGRCYDPRTMLKVIFYGYHRGIYSSRKLAWSCKSTVQFIYLTGDIQVGWRSIARFRSDHAEELVYILQQIIELGYRVGIVQGKFGYQDGVKIHANAANERFKTKEEWARIAKELEQDIREYFNQCVKQDSQEDLQFGKDNDGSSLPQDFSVMKDSIKNLVKETIESNHKAVPEKSTVNPKPELPEKPESPAEEALHHKEELVDEISNDIEMNVLSEDDISIREETEADKVAQAASAAPQKAEDVPKSSAPSEITEEELLEKSEFLVKIHALLDANRDAPDSTKLNLTDPECRFMKSHGKIDGSYNGQIITENQFITAADLSTHETDFGEMKGLIEKHKDILPEGHSGLEDYGADAGYFSSQNLEYLHEKDIRGFIPKSSERTKRALADLPESEQKLRVYDFEYDEDKDEFLCPGGHTLEFHSDRIVDGKKQQVYNCKPEHCVTCQWRARCLSTQADQRQGYRQLIVDPSFDLKKEMKERLESEPGKEFYGKRKIEPESVFGNIRHNKGFRQFLLRGARKVRGEFMILCGVHNIEKLIRYMRRNPGLSW